MDRKEVSPQSSKMDAPNAKPDATVFNEPTHPSYEDNKVPDDVTSRLSPEGSDEVAPTAQDTVPLSPELSDPNYYNMSGDKYLIIFNHYQYEKWQNKQILKPSDREGTYEDVDSLQTTFHGRGFKVIPHHDCTHKEIMKHLTDLCKKNHRNTSCIAVAVMTHGLDTYLCAADTVYPVSDLTNTVQATRSLDKKPKLFFIQACREKHVKLPTQPNKKFEVPLGVDCLCIFSTYRDYVSYRSPTDGTWMMQALCKTINENHATMHFVQMVTLVNDIVSKKDAYLGRGVYCKQTSVTEFNLKKLLKL